MDLYMSGYGAVARAFVELLHTKTAKIESNYHFKPVLKGIFVKQGLVFCPDGFDYAELLALGQGSMAVLAYAKKYNLAVSQQFQLKGGVLIEATSTSPNSGEPGYRYMKAALQQGLDIVAVSKGALVHHFDEIMALSKQLGRRIKFSGATAAALPALDTGMYSLAGSTIKRFEGVLNGTTSYILDEMHKHDLTVEQALKKAQEAGIAEKDPTLDIGGYDSANKVLLLANQFFQARASISDVSIEGIATVSLPDVHHAKQENQKIVLLASASDENGQISMSVKPTKIAYSHPLAHLAPKEKGICFFTEEMGRIAVTGGASSPLGAASAALKDVIHLSDTH
ncbi:homoserine dehydrogenase [Shouchella clausii]|uniref:homoserine dehydrogenase n=1 Tax=Shouchella clausii TaxID=79880 RepID=UPI0009E2C7F7|nr:homoserine dehydrogenase [Shouchella clausii]